MDSPFSLESITLDFNADMDPLSRRIHEILPIAGKANVRIAIEFIAICTGLDYKGLVFLNSQSSSQTFAFEPSRSQQSSTHKHTTFNNHHNLPRQR